MVPPNVKKNLLSILSIGLTVSDEYGRDYQ